MLLQRRGVWRDEDALGRYERDAQLTRSYPILGVLRPRDDGGQHGRDVRWLSDDVPQLVWTWRVSTDSPTMRLVNAVYEVISEHFDASAPAFIRFRINLADVVTASISVLACCSETPGLSRPSTNSQ